MSQPKRQAAELLEQLNALRQHPQHDDIALARIEREARQLLSTDFGDARMLLGLVAPYLAPGHRATARTHMAPGRCRGMCVGLAAPSPAPVPSGTSLTGAAPP